MEHFKRLHGCGFRDSGCLQLNGLQPWELTLNGMKPAPPCIKERSLRWDAQSQDPDSLGVVTHRPLSSSFLLWFIFRILYQVIPKRNYLGAYGYRDKKKQAQPCTTTLRRSRCCQGTLNTCPRTWRPISGTMPTRVKKAVST